MRKPNSHKPTSKGNKNDKRCTKSKSTTSTNAGIETTIVPESKDRTNDPSWYAKNPQLMAAAGSFAFSNVLGTKIPYSKMGSIPGVFSVVYSPSLGSNDPAIVATRNIYSFVRHANSGAKVYDAPDLMMYILAVDSAFSFISCLQRAYGVLNLYDQKNKYYPYALLHAMGFDFDDLLNHQSEFNFYINQLVAKASVLWVPDNLPLIERHFWMNANMFTDGESSKAQTYIFRPIGFWKYNPTKSDRGGGLDVIEFAARANEPKITFNKLKEIGNEIFSQLDSNNEDFGIMGGDILKAYGKEHIYTLNEVPFDYTVMPTYSKEVLTQIHNSSTIQIMMQGVSQNERGEIFMDQFEELVKDSSYNLINLPENQMLDFFQAENPTPEQVMVATRLKPGGVDYADIGEGDTAKRRYIMNILGTEYPVRYEIYHYEASGALHTFAFGSQSMDLNGLDHSYYIQVTAYISMFDWAPFLYVHRKGAGNGTEYVVGDCENYTFINNTNLVTLHTTATWSEFGIPTM